MNERRPPTLAKINLTAFAASEGQADAQDVRQALDVFYRLAAANRPIPPRLISFVAESFGRYLGLKDFYGPNERSADSLDSAFGLLRKTGRPEADEQRRIEMAAAVLRLRLRNNRHESALEAAAEKFASNTDTIGKAWKVHWQDVIAVVRNERDRDAYPWTADEKRSLEAIIRDRAKRSQGAPKKSTQGKSLK